jgi:uncharacterized peroxidase-related enzyme
MSRIPALDPSSATGRTKELLDGVHKGLGATPNLFRVAAQSPATLEAMTGLFGAVTKGAFNAKAREALALTVSEHNACDYCLSAHSALGAGAGLSQAQLDDARLAKAEDPRLAAALVLARKIAAQRGHIDDATLATARAQLSDAEVLEVVTNVALTTLTNYLNSVARTDIDFPVVTHHAR